MITLRALNDTLVAFAGSGFPFPILRFFFAKSGRACFCFLLDRFIFFHVGLLKPRPMFVYTCVLLCIYYYLYILGTYIWC